MVSTHPIRIKARLSRLVLGFYGSVEHAEEALHEVRKNHFRRSGVVHQTDDGHLKFLHAGFSPSNRAAAATAVAIVVGLTANVLRSDVWELVLAVPSGFLITWFGTLWLGLGLRNKILRHYGRFVLPGESLVVVQESEEHTADVIAVLRSIAHPSVFAIRPALRLGPSSQFEETSREPVTMASLPDCAAELAASHVLKSSTKSVSLLPILRECEDAIERARADLGEAARLEYGITHAAEWLLDNTYLIRSHIAEIRHNLPDNHNKILPVIADTSVPVQVRIYHIAADLIGRTGLSGDAGEHRQLSQCLSASGAVDHRRVVGVSL